MKKRFLLIFMMFMPTFLSIAHAKNHELNDSNQHFSERDVIPFSLENLEINNNGIFLNHHGEWIQLRGITQDDHGNFMGATDEWSFTWECPKCSFKNSPFSNTCGRCGYKPPR